MEIERKYLIHSLPENLAQYPHRQIEQGYLCREPVLRIRRDGADYVFTYKSKGMLAREEYNLPLNEQAYEELKQKVSGGLITKTRYCLPLSDHLTIELDIFEGYLAPLVLAEVEFPTEEEALAFQPPKWFGEDVTFSQMYHNSTLSQKIQ